MDIFKIVNNSESQSESWLTPAIPSIKTIKF